MSNSSGTSGVYSKLAQGSSLQGFTHSSIVHSHMNSEDEKVKDMVEGIEENSGWDESEWEEATTHMNREDKMLKMIELMATDMRTSRKEKQKDGYISKAKVVVRIKDSKEGTSIEQFLDSLEIELSQVKIKRKEYKRILISKLSPKTKTICNDLIQSEVATYEDSKHRLLAKTGLSLNEVAMKL